MSCKKNRGGKTSKTFKTDGVGRVDRIEVDAKGHTGERVIISAGSLPWA
jgi:hypothetical protein